MHRGTLLIFMLNTIILNTRCRIDWNANQSMIPKVMVFSISHVESAGCQLSNNRHWSYVGPMPLTIFHGTARLGETAYRFTPWRKKASESRYLLIHVMIPWP